MSMKFIGSILDDDLEDLSATMGVEETPNEICRRVVRILRGEGDDGARDYQAGVDRAVDELQGVARKIDADLATLRANDALQHAILCGGADRI